MAHVPPTVNQLDRCERSRLVRSNRKLEAVLGTAPYYLEPDSPLDTPKASRREGRIFVHSPTSSSSSPTLGSIAEIASPFNPFHMASKSKQGPRTLELSRPLLLRLRSKPVSPSDVRASQTSSSCPSSSPASPLSPTLTIDSEKLRASNLKTRRRKIEKLTRTLGENIPPELVFPNATRTHVKSRSLEDVPVPRSPNPRPVISRPKAMSSRSRHKIPAAPSDNPAIHIRLPTRQTSQTRPTIAERRRQPRPRSLSVSTGIDMLSAAQVRSRSPVAKRKNDIGLLRFQTTVNLYPKPQYLTVHEKAKDIFESHSPLPFQSVEAPQHPCAKLASALSSPTTLPPSANVPSAFRQFGKRKELGWSGEWNHDMQNVVKNLRNLKAR